MAVWLYHCMLWDPAREREREKEGEWSLFTAAGGVTKHGEGRVIAAYSVHSLARRPL